MVSGLLLLGLGWAAILQDAVPPATTLFALGGASLFAAPLVSRLEGKLRFGPVELTLRQQVIKAAQSADEESLEGMLPLLTSDEVSVGKLRLPDRFAGLKLTNPKLGFLRKGLDVSVVGVRQPDDKSWRAGGAISKLKLPKDTELLVAGHPDTIGYLRFLVASDNDELWRRVTGPAPRRRRKR